MNRSVASPYEIRPAAAVDCAEICTMIRELAAFEDLLDQVETAPEALERCLFSPQPEAVALVAAGDGGLVGYAIFFTTFSTFKARPGLWLEDLYVRPRFRGAGIGKALLQAGAAMAADRGYGRYEWCVLDWNSDAVAFYENAGATVLPDWRIVRVEGDALAALAAKNGLPPKHP